jgi:hypothetical protein
MNAQIYDNFHATPDPTGAAQAPTHSTLIDEIKNETTRAQATNRANDPEDDGHGINPRTIQAKLHSTQTATTAAIGAGFEFTPEEVAAQLKLCQEQLRDLRIDLQKAKRTQDLVYEPAPDDASRTQANAVKNMIASTVNAINADIAYLTNWQHKLDTAKQNYMSTEHLNEHQWTRLSLGLQP